MYIIIPHQNAPHNATNRTLQESLANAKISAPQPWHTGYNSLNYS